MLQNKLPKGYYIVCMIFILTVLINFSYVDGNAQILIDFGPYHAYVSDVGLALCKAYIYTISIYGLINNTSWGLISTTLIAFLIGIINLKDLIAYGDSIFVIGSISFLCVFAYLVFIISKKVRETLSK